MAPNHYVLGIDFGTLAARAVLVDVVHGSEVAWHEQPYEHGVIEGSLPHRPVPLPPGAARQDPGDYLNSLRTGVRQVLRQADIAPEAVIAVGLDFTSCTLLPVDAQGRPLCWDERFRDNPDAWVCLWKDQTAQPEATLMTERAQQRGEPFLKRLGGKISAESFLPKVWRIRRSSPEVFQAAACFLEAGDWVVWQLIKQPVGGLSAASYKALWDNGFPEAYLASLDPALLVLAKEKTLPRYLPPGSVAGPLDATMAKDLGLPPGIPVAVANIDAHAAVPGSGVAEPGTLVLVMGTSLCHMLLGDALVHVPGIVGAVRDGIIPGYVGYEAGQPAAGDLLTWFARNFVPRHYAEEAARVGVSVQQYLEQLASRLGPGETGLVALDWWNGNRSPLMNGALSGLIVGYSLQTRPEDVYRALMEGLAFGTYEILRTFEEAGLPVQILRACGGVAGRSPLTLQILADVTGRPIQRCDSPHASALGAAVFAAVAAGSARGGYDTVAEAVARIIRPPAELYRPDPQRQGVYQQVYRVYRELFDHFGRGGSAAMATLRALQAQAKRARAGQEASA